MKIKSMNPHFDYILSGERAPKETNHIIDPNAHVISYPWYLFLVVSNTILNLQAKK